MRKLRVLSCVLLACFISCTTLGAAFASGILIDDLPIDPWGDLEDVENYEPPEPTDPVFSDPYETPSVEVPSNGGIMTMSLDDENMSRYVSWNNTLTYGGYMSSYLKREYTVSATSNFPFTYSSSGMFTLASTTTSDYGGGYILVPAGTTVDVYANVSYPVAEYDTLNISGGGEMALVGFASIMYYAYPTTAQLMINGNLYGEAVSVSSTGVFSFDAVTIDLTEDITKVGYRFTYSSEVEDGAYKSTKGTSTNLYLLLKDNAVFMYAEKPEEPEYNGILETIVGWLRNVWEAIKNIGLNILDGLKGLFVPSEDDITEIKDMYATLLEERLGFVYEAFVMLDEAITELKTAFESGNGYTFTFPGISFPMNGEIITIVEEQEINMENEFMDTVRPVFGTIVCLFSVAGVVRTGADMVVAIISGVSPFAFYRKADEIWETLWGEDS